MIKNTSLFLIIISITAILSGCSDRKDQLQLIDAGPEILLSKTTGNERKEVMTDSIRYYDNPAFYYNLKMYLKDSNKNLWKLNYSVQKGNAKVYYDAIPLELASIRADLEEINLSISPKQKGELSIDFIATDRFNNQKIATLNLFVFDNLRPIAQLTSIKTSLNASLEYSFDASKSFDQDAKYNGKIIGYYFNIEGRSIETTSPTISYIFKSPGQYNIELKVQDNNGAFSDPLIYKLNVQ